MKKDTLITGLALFAMFFGAGNLIFPPFLGMESGTDWVIGFLCFILIDVALSCLGIFALNAAGGANAAVEGSLGRVPGLVLNTAVILCTGMIIAEPRTAATTYEMSMIPLFGDSVNMLAFSALFFAVVLALSIRQTRLVSIIGKVLTPLLVLCVLRSVPRFQATPRRMASWPVTRQWTCSLAWASPSSWRTRRALRAIRAARISSRSSRALPWLPVPFWLSSMVV